MTMLKLPNGRWIGTAAVLSLQDCSYDGHGGYHYGESGDTAVVFSGNRAEAIKDHTPDQIAALINEAEFEQSVRIAWAAAGRSPEALKLDATRQSYEAALTKLLADLDELKLGNAVLRARNEELED